MKSVKKIIILASICLVILVGAIIGDNYINNRYFKRLSYDEVMDKLENDESFVLVISQTTCSICTSYKPKIKEIAEEYKIVIYYIEYDKFSSDERSKFDEVISFSGTPQTIFIQDGEEKTAANRITGMGTNAEIIKRLKSNGYISE